MPGRLFVFLVSVGVCAGYFIKDEHKAEPFDYLLLAQFWPPTSCYVYFGKEHCSGIPDVVTGWTIHGLWPSRPGTEEPQFCNKSATFDPSQIKSLASQMNVQWHYYDTSGDPTSLWSHEWEKHGTCAGSLPRLKGELNYFKNTMQLQKPLNISGVLAKHGVVPSPTVLYKPYDFYDALKAEFKVVPNIACSYGHETKKHYVEQVWLCFNKSLELINCPDVSINNMPGRKSMDGMPMRHEKQQTHFSDCPEPDSKSIYYLPFRPPPSETQDEKVVYFHSELREVITWP